MEISEVGIKPYGQIYLFQNFGENLLIVKYLLFCHILLECKWDIWRTENFVKKTKYWFDFIHTMKNTHVVS